ncbi:MAG: Ser/Thr protein phosphatase [Candidatus Saccharibacteria bacterium]|nr:Ser/Thr protein phosphatase [Candidatus Saccharibacteria bacterium]
MNILYIGDIMGNPGMDVVAKVLPELKKQHQLDLVIAQGENVSDGKGMLPEDMARLQKIGVDFFTGGNHTPKREELKAQLEDPAQPVIGPANMPSCPGPGWKYIEAAQGKVLVISILGDTVGNNSPIILNPLEKIDQILKANAHEQKAATVVNFHGDFSSEKRVFGYYLDGRVSAVVGDHWHVPTADAMILPQHTGYISDVGMCGTLHSSLGVKTDIIIRRWRDHTTEPNALETEGPLQFNAVLIKVNRKGLSENIESVHKIIE